jgi:HlyD family type I secretion membrane fusion protein
MKIFNKRGLNQTSDNSGQLQLGSRERRLLAESAQIEEELVPAFVRPLLIVVGIIIVVSLIWAAFTNLTEVARAQGEIAPTGEIKVVQHLDGGIISVIKVENRTLVDPGQELLRIDGAQVIADLRQMNVRLVSLRLRGERLSAFAEGRNPKLAPLAKGHADLLADQMEIYRTQTTARSSTLAILDRQIDQRVLRIQQLKKSLDIATQQQSINGELVNMREGLASRHLVNRAVLLETRGAKVTADGEAARLTEEINVVGQELAEIKSRRADTYNQLRRDAMTEVGTVRAEIAEVTEMVQRLEDKVARLIVRSSIRGYVHDLKVHTIGQVVQPGALLMQVVPTEAPLEAVVHISPQDIGYVKTGQAVNMRVSTFDYTRFGFAHGKLTKVSASSLVDDKGLPYFQGWVTLDSPFVGEKHDKPVKAGMGVEAEILTGHRTLIAYLLKPLEDLNSRSFSER